MRQAELPSPSAAAAVVTKAPSVGAVAQTRLYFNSSVYTAQEKAGTSWAGESNV